MSALPPRYQALYHAGCACRHVGKAVAALWQLREARLAVVFVLLAVLLAMTGCGAIGRLVMPSPVAKLEKAQEKRADSADAVLKQGQEYAEAAGKALARDKAPSAESSTASSLLSRANKSFSLALGPLLPARDTYLDSLVDKLLSENATLRAEGAKILAEKDRDADKAAQALAAANAKITELTGKVAVFAAERDAIARKWERLWFWIWAVLGSWVFVAFVLPLVGRAFPVLGGVATVAQSVVAPFAAAGLTKAKRVLGDVVAGVEEMRTTLKAKGTISKAEADATLREYVCESNGTAAVIDAIRREKGLL